MPGERYDLAIVGAGIAGTYIADRLQRERPDWSVAVFERTDRIGGRLRSVPIGGLDYPIELGGMRFMSSHRRVASIVDDFALPTRPFDRTGGHERALLRRVFARGPGDPAGGKNYRLDANERGQSALELWQGGFERIAPNWERFEHDDFVRLRATGEYLGRRVTDWSMGDALRSSLSADGWRYVRDAFGYDSGIRAFNATDLIEFLRSGGDPTAVARTPDRGMESIPRSLAERFERRGGAIRLGHEVTSIEMADRGVVLQFSNGRSIQAGGVVVTVPVRALELLAGTSPALQYPNFRQAFAAVEGFFAMKLYLWYDRPWWRPAVSGIRTVTDLPVRKTFYLDDRPDAPAALLAMYTDAMDMEPWLELAEGTSDGAPAPRAMLSEVQRCLREMHPESAVPEPVGSALMHWGADPHEVAWHFWRGGAVSDEVLELAPQPEPSLPIYLAGEAFSRQQSWVEGALEAAEAVLERLLAAASADSVKPLS
jgi:monoamine oxidase